MFMTMDLRLQMECRTNKTDTNKQITSDVASCVVASPVVKSLQLCRQHHRNHTHHKVIIEEETKKNNPQEIYNSLQQFTTTSMKKSQSTASHRVNGNSYTCRHKDSSTPCDCNQPPAKTMFAVMGRDGTQKFASSSTSSAMYCNNKNIEPPKRTCYWNRYKQPYVKHEFSLRLDNTQDGCPVDDVMDAEIWINELYAFDVGQCTHA